MTERCVAPKFMTRFSCTASACEDSCCCHWRVPLDRAAFERLQELVRLNPQPGSPNVLLKRPKKVATDQLYGEIQMRSPGQECPFLDERRLCSVQMQQGPAALPTVCHQFPRYFVRINSRLELAGTLACPETARLCLADDDAMELVDTDADAGRRSELDFVVDSQVGVYAETFEEVRGLLLRLLADNEFSMKARLFFAAYLGHHLSAFLHTRSRSLDVDSYQDLLRRMSHPLYLKELSEQREQLAVKESLALEIVHAVLQSHLTRYPGTRLSATLREVWRSYGLPTEGPQKTGKGKGIERISEALELYRARRAVWEPAFSASIDKYVAHMALSYVYAYPYIGMPDLKSYVRRFTILLACFRFLLFSHASLLSRPAASQGSGTDPQEALQRAAVDSAFLLSRTLTHDQAMTRILEQELDKQGIRGLAHFVCLAQL